MALNEFQKVGGIKSLSEEYVRILTDAFSEKYGKPLALWALGGIGGEGDPQKHWAQYMVTYSGEQNFQIQSIQEYYEKILSEKGKLQFGTIFSWTYASGSKGKNIQLKTWCL